MKVVLLSTFLKYGGAAVCCTRLATALKKSGLEVEVLYLMESKKVFGQSPIINSLLSKVYFYFNFILERIKVLFSIKDKKDLFKFSIGKSGYDLSNNQSIKEANIIHLHWVSFTLLSIRGISELSKIKPVIWTLHDMWAFTGGCHYAYDCSQYQNSCLSCFYLKNTHFANSKEILRSKESAWFDCDFDVVGTSNWLAELARKSKVFGSKRVSVLPTPIDVDLFRPVRKNSSLNYNLLFGAVDLADERKGFKYLTEALEIVDKQVSNLCINIFGEMNPDLLIGFDAKINYLGTISDLDSLVKAYSDADIFVLPSIQDNLPNTVMEAMACETPVVTFKSGGVVDMVQHKENGYVADLKDAKDLASGILYFTDESIRKLASRQARAYIIENYSESSIAKEHIDFYQNVLTHWN